MKPASQTALGAVLLLAWPFSSWAQSSWMDDTPQELTFNLLQPIFTRGDINGDGRHDFAIVDGLFAQFGAARIFQTHNSGEWRGYSLPNIATPSGSGIVSAELIDLEGDRRPELVILKNGGELIVYPNVNGRLQAPVSPHPLTLTTNALGVGESFYATDTQVVDLNGDGKQEWLLTIQRRRFNIYSPEYRAVFKIEFDAGTTSQNSIGLKIKELINHLDERFNSTRDWWSETTPMDINGDGIQDIASITEASSPNAQAGDAGYLWVKLGRGNDHNGNDTYQNLTRPIDLGFGNGNCLLPESMVATDLNGDGKDDLIIGCGKSPKIGIAMNQIQSIQNGQVSGQMQVEWFDLSNLGVQWINTVHLANMQRRMPFQKSLIVLARNRFSASWQVLAFERQGDSFDFSNPRIDQIDHQGYQDGLRDEPNPQYLHLVDMDNDGYPDPLITWRTSLPRSSPVQAIWFKNSNHGLGPRLEYGQGFSPNGYHPSIDITTPAQVGTNLGIEVKGIPAGSQVMLTWGFERNFYPNFWGAMCPLLVNWFVELPFFEVQRARINRVTGEPHALFEYNLHPAGVRAMAAVGSHSTYPHTRIHVQGFIYEPPDTPGGVGYWSCTPGLEFYTFPGLQY